MSEKQKCNVQFNLMLTARESEALKKLSAAESISAAQVLRLALRARVAMANGNPVCGNGQNCFMPQMHIRNNPPC